MKKILLAVIAASTVFVVAPAMAADSDAPSFENGPVWQFGQIQTKDGHFDDYMHWLATDWKAQEEALKKAGVIMDYKVYVVTDARQGEPDIILAQEYKNMAAFDQPVSEQYAMQAKISGSIAKADTEQAARGTIRTVMGTITAREVTLK